MAEQRRNQRPTGGRPSGGRPTGGGRPSSSRSSEGRPDRGGRSDSRDSRDSRGDRDSRGGRGGPSRDRKSGPRGAGSGRSVEKEAPRSADQAVYDGPDLPEDITGKELDRAVIAQLKGLPEKLAARVARHLAAAGALIDEEEI